MVEHLLGENVRKTVRTAVLVTLATATAVGLGAQEARITDSAVSIASGPGGQAAIQIELADGSDHVISFESGSIRIDDREVGRYETGGALEAAWRAFLVERAGGSASDLGDALWAWPTEGEAADADLEGFRAALSSLLGRAESTQAPVETSTLTGPSGRQLAIAPGGIDLDALTRQLETLHESLGELGESAAQTADDLALIVHDDYAILEDQTVEGNLALLDGELSVAGAVAGGVLVLDGELSLAPTGRIDGDILQVGGEIETLSGQLAGELLSLQPVAPATPRVVVEAPRARARVVRERRASQGPFDRLGRNIGRASGGLAELLSCLAGLAVAGLIGVYFARPRLEVVADTVRNDFGRSFAMGLAGEVLFFPVLLILVVLVITWLVLPFYVLATGLAFLMGYLAVAHTAGEMFARRRYRYEWLERLRRSNSYYYVLSGLVLLLLPFAIASMLWLLGGLTGFLRGLIEFVASLATWVLMTAGFGAVLLTRAGSRGETVGFGPWATESAEGPGSEETGGEASDA
jgi:hypothetical protein